MIHSFLTWIFGAAIELLVFCTACGCILHTVFSYSRDENVITALVLPFGISAWFLVVFRNDFWWLVPTALVGGVGLLLLPSIAEAIDANQRKQNMAKSRVTVNPGNAVTKTETFYFEEEEMLPARRDNAPPTGREIARNAEVVNADLVARITDMVTKAIASGSGEMKIEANQIRTVQPDGTRVRQTSLVVGVVIDAKRR